MSYNMMCKRGCICLGLLAFWLFALTADAEEKHKAYEEEILVVYSDDVNADNIHKVHTVIESLTYQNFRVTFASASDSISKCSNFKYIIFFEIEKYPPAFVKEVFNVEKKTNTKLLFVGNQFLKEYLNHTSREQSYVELDEKAGRLQYQFQDYEVREALVNMDSFVFLTGDYSYVSGEMYMEEENVYFCASTETITHISASDFESAVVKAAFINEVTRWKLGETENMHAYAQYMVLNEVYPFQSHEKLYDIIQLMKENQVPYVISVMPVYINGDYPTMQRFCEILRYAQDHGATIILRAPLNQMSKFDASLVNEYIAQAVTYYIEQGVYPMGIQIPANWLINEETEEVISRFQTIFVSEEDDIRLKREVREGKSPILNEKRKWIAPSVTQHEEGVSYTGAYSTAMYVSLDEDESSFREVINAFRVSYLPLKSLWDMEHSFWTNIDTIIYDNHVLSVNGKPLSTAFIANSEEDTDYNYQRNTLQRFSKDLTNQSQKLIKAVVGVSILFLLFIIIARRNNKSRFFYEEEDKDEYWENK